MKLTSRCGHFVASDLSIGKDVVLGELYDSESKLIKVFNVKRTRDFFVVSVGSSGNKARFDLMA